MKFDSIKSRLVLMTLICVIGMGMLVASQHYFTQRLINLNQQRDLLLRMGQDLLQMRRHEKDFLLRHQESYFHQFNGRAETFSEKLNTLSPLFAQYQVSNDLGGDLAEALNEYQQLFRRVVNLQTEIGLTYNSGLLGHLHELEESLLNDPYFGLGSEALVQFDAARLALRDFQLTKDQFHATHALQLVDYLKSRIDNGNEPLRQRIVAYQLAVTTLVSHYQDLGLSHNEGLQGTFRAEAHNVESRLGNIDKALQPLITEQENRVKVYSISIAVMTSIVLILVLIKSFATFHRAFANFVMFFYRCKRQYQKIDTRKLGFAEFKSLAELANEMVESRKSIEDRLASVEAELAQQTKASAKK